MSEKQIQVGIIGLQGYGGTYFAVLSALPYVTVRAVCDTKEEVLNRAADKHRIPLRFTDYKKMLEDEKIDAVFIATPHFLHYRMTMDALQAGKHVFCEKPLAMNAKEAKEMVETAAERGLILSCHYNRRQSSLVKLLKDAVNKEVLGDIYAAHVKWMARYTPFMFSEDSAWRTVKSKAGGGILIGRGSHMIDAALSVLGYPAVRSISANVCSRLTGLEVDDYCILLLRLKNGSSVTIECSYECNLPSYKERISYQLLGTKAGAYCAEEDGKETCSMGYCRFPEEEWIDISEQFSPASYQSSYPENMIADFVEALREGRKPLITGEDALYVTAVIDAAYQSAGQGREIILEENPCISVNLIKRSE